jgi:hypothetical protein
MLVLLLLLLGLMLLSLLSFSPPGPTGCVFAILASKLVGRLRLLPCMCTQGGLVQEKLMLSSPPRVSKPVWPRRL